MSKAAEILTRNTDIMTAEELRLHKVELSAISFNEYKSYTQKQELEARRQLRALDPRTDDQRAEDDRRAGERQSVRFGQPSRAGRHTHNNK